MINQFDIIVVGAGHAGIEAGNVCAKQGLNTAVLTLKKDSIGEMSCNPSIGGLAKGHIVREVDVLGGLMGLAADYSCIQFKRLNSNKGPAVRGSRAQCDRDLYSKSVTSLLLNQTGITLLEVQVEALHIENNRCGGVRLSDGSILKSRVVILTTGTFLNGLMHIGCKKTIGGRVGERSSSGLSQQLKAFGLGLGRLKTGTPPRLHKDSIHWDKLEPQSGDKKFFPFSFRSAPYYQQPQIDCHLTYTNEQTHEIIKSNLELSPMYCGQITGIGPRYCPSIEDKIVRFADKTRHQSFLEPEGLNSHLVYLQGISTSLPEEIQILFLKTINGLEDVKVIRPGYAVEYDFVYPTQLKPTLECKAIENLFLAGQINGTSGYEEAAGQGLVAGVNASNHLLGKEDFILGRDESYIGVLIDDLVTKGTQEPYRMLTSRAEFRLNLREDNTLNRLLNKSHQFSLIPGELFEKLNYLLEKQDECLMDLKNKKVYPTKELNEKLIKLQTAPLCKPLTLEEILRRKEVTFKDLMDIGEYEEVEQSISEPVEIFIKYSGYIKRQDDILQDFRKAEQFQIPESFNFFKVQGLSSEEKEKLTLIRPRTLGQAQRISGVNPTAIQALIVNIKGLNKNIKEHGSERERG